MNARLPTLHPPRTGANTRSPFDLDDDGTYRRWRDAKRALQPARIDDLVVEVGDPRRLRASESAQLRRLCGHTNMAIYRSPVTAADKEIPRRLAQQLGLHRLDANWLADDDGISPIAVAAGTDAGAAAGGDRVGFIPYTNRPIKWHTDGYYHPPARRIEAMLLHCVAPAREGGVNALMDPEMAYIALREADPDLLRALMAADAMTIPARTDDAGVARAAQTGPVFSTTQSGAALHMRYTARTRSIEWKPDAATRAAVAWLERLLAGDDPAIFRIRLEAGMGIVSNNVLHDRSGFVDDPQRPRLLYRARYLDRIA
ncbi:MAG: TauD/TfdA family dioxygenase [Burkholderiales bacterium]|nr:TauD/TfdA family dioxygenase [Burkholderiales bacterium]MDE2628792.1 TauD/TfdA family dioxygenase [Burkholderiales bacterium]